ncbi:MAG TPA: V-type ATPase subunit [Sedimentisphaerales bacterium]|nr:V-type ATPase subunit [Sedimentisphaerales bacterium]
MRDTKPEQAILDFYTYPPIGGDDWRYAFETATIRAIEMQMLSRTTLLDMANAESFDQAADLLSAGEYALPRSGAAFAELENVLRQRRAAARELFAALCIDKPIVKLFRTRDDFANLRLALRRTLTQKPVGADYSDQGNVPPEQFQQVFQEENDELFPDYMRQAADRAALAYYQNKDIRRIDYSVDSFQAEYNLETAHRLESIFLIGLFKIEIDLTNIRTMLRLKFTEAEQRNVFLEGGYIQPDRLENGLDLGYEALGQLFFATPYYRVVDAGANYLASNKSFLKLEQQRDEHLTGFLKTTVQITAGPQPIIAYLLLKENEIRTVRLILTAKKNNLDTKLILDRIS